MQAAAPRSLLPPPSFVHPAGALPAPRSDPYRWGGQERGAPSFACACSRRNASFRSCVDGPARALGLARAQPCALSLARASLPALHECLPRRASAGCAARHASAASHMGHVPQRTCLFRFAPFLPILAARAARAIMCITVFLQQLVRCTCFVMPPSNQSTHAHTFSQGTQGG